jgi:hypothetical protein
MHGKTTGSSPFCPPPHSQVKGDQSFGVNMMVHAPLSLALNPSLITTPTWRELTEVTNCEGTTVVGANPESFINTYITFW